MKRSFVLLLALGASITTMAAIASTGDDKREAIKKDRQQIEGNWQIVGLEINGAKTKAEDVQKLTVINGSDGTWKVLSEGKEISRGTSKFDPTQKPKTIDFTPTEGGGKGNLYLGIYELGDKARRMCFAPPGKPRPSEFVSAPGSDIILVSFERKSNE